MKIPEEKINEIRDSVDILDVVSQYVSLRKRGKSYLGLCPFHQEKTPSFHVDPVKGFFHCFGCGEGGNAFTFIMKMDKVTFPEAVRTLAKKANIDLPENDEDIAVLQETEALYHVNQAAARFYQECLHSTEGGKRALHYLEQRKFDQKIIENFQLGFSPDSWDGLIRKAEKESIPSGHLLKAGLIVEKKDGSGYYDRFRGRLMFPIHNTSGRVVGFGARILEDTQGVPKYINSPETAVYRKGHLLYGLYQSRKGIQKENSVLLVEGYTDLMRLHLEGIDYCVATAGTALTDGQAVLISRYAKHVILVYDGDSAGFSAALRGADILLAAGLDVQVVPLPGSHDPDDYLKQFGKNSFLNLLTLSKSIIDFQLEQKQDGHKPNTPAERSRVAGEVLETIQKIKDPVERQLMIHELSDRMGIPEDLLHQKMRKVNRNEDGKTQSVDSPSSSVREKAETALIRMLLLENGKWIRPVLSIIQPEDFFSPVHARIVHIIQEHDQNGRIPDQTALLSAHEDDIELHTRLVGFISDPLTESVDFQQLGLDCILFIKEEKLKQKIKDIREEIRQAKNDEIRAEPLRLDYHNLKKELEELRTEVILSWKKGVEKF